MSEALVLYGSPETWATLRHEVPLVITDPLLFADVDGRKVVLTTFLESARIGAVMPEAEIVDFFDRGLKELILDEGMEREAAVREVAARTVTDLGIDRAIVPGDFPLALADRLRELGVAVVVDDAAVSRRRRAKTGHELDGVIAAQRAAEAGMAAAAAMLREAERGPDGLPCAVGRRCSPRTSGPRCAPPVPSTAARRRRP
jgi:Xaa-Pro aminopeptidase